MVLWHGGKVELGGGGGGHKNIVLFPPLHSVVSLFGMSSKGVSQIDTMTMYFCSNASSYLPQCHGNREASQESFYCQTISTHTLA